MDRGLKVSILLKESMKRHYELDEDLNSDLMTFLGFVYIFEEYPETYPDYFRVVDLRKGKKIDDGYRAIHLYYQRNNLAYPIEI